MLIKNSFKSFGNFDGDDRVDFFLAAKVEGADSVGLGLQSFAVSGRDGSLLWRKDGSEESVWHRQMAPSHQMPTVVDANRDGRDDIALVALDLCMVLDGRDGSFLQEPTIANTIWQQQPDKDGQWTAYGIQIPIDVNGDVDGDGNAEFLAGGACIQATGPDAGKVLWRLTESTVGPPLVVDMDGDGTSELLYLCADGKMRIFR